MPDESRLNANLININLDEAVEGNAPITAAASNPKAGFIYPLASDIVPEGFLLCDGAEYLRVEYPELFAAIGTMYGSGDGSTTFNVPNLQTRVPVGKGEGYELGDIGGEETHTLTIDEMPSHNHDVDARVSKGSIGNPGYVIPQSNDWWIEPLQRIGSTNSIGGSQPHNNMQPYTVVNYIIATGKDTGVSVADIITGIQALPLGVEYGGTGATNILDIHKNLGIKATAINLLDNSDFRNPVNQRGQTSYNSAGYTFDRWINMRDSDTMEIVENGMKFTGLGSRGGGIYQYVDYKILAGKTVTLAVKVRNATNGSCLALRTPAWGSYINMPIPAGDSIVICTASVPADVSANIPWSINTDGLNNEYSFILEWAALYEGEYTAETLPEYQPKGYGVEIVNCNKGALAMELLWQNASPSSDFAAQTITLDLSQIDVVKIIYKAIATSNNEHTFETSVNSSSTIINFLNTAHAAAVQASTRDLTINSNEIIFANCVNKQITSTSAALTLNSRLIPVRIYGIKGVSV